jgi:hypothetical protein
MASNTLPDPWQCPLMVFNSCQGRPANPGTIYKRAHMHQARDDLHLSAAYHQTPGLGTIDQGQFPNIA